MEALDRLLEVHADTVLRSVYDRLNQLAADTSKEIAIQIEHGMRAAVHRMVESELGGSLPVAATEAASHKLRVDVFAFPSTIDDMQVRRAFNGTLDLRFINPDATESYVPSFGSHVILLTNRIPKPLRHTIERSGVDAQVVKPTAGHVIQAIEELHRASGLAMH